MLTVHRVSVSFDGESHLLSELSFTLQQGSCMLLTGAASSGKTLLLSVCGGIVPQLIRPKTFAGKVTVRGKDINDRDADGTQHKIGFVMQSVEDQIWELLVEDLIAFSLENDGIARPEIRKRVFGITEQFGISRLLGRRFSTLSGGEKRIVSLASVVIREPEILLLDEPTSGLDPEARSQMIAILEALSAQGMTLLIAEQDLAWFANMADRILFLGGHGNIAMDIAWKDILDNLQVFKDVGIQPPTFLQPLPARRKHQPCNTDVPALEIRGLSSALKKRNGERILNALDVDLYVGEIVALIGPNGAGKSTFVQALLGLKTRHEGTILISGEETENLSIAERARHIGYVPQDTKRMFFLLSVVEEVVFSLSGGGTGQKAVEKHREAALSLLTRVNLHDKADISPFALSSREQLMLALVCVEATCPSLIVLDEPLIAWDATWRDKLLEFLERCHFKGLAVMMITHDLSLAHQAADRLLIMRQGQFLFDGPIQEGWRSRAFQKLGWPRPDLGSAHVSCDFSNTQGESENVGP